MKCAFGKLSNDGRAFPNAMPYSEIERIPNVVDWFIGSASTAYIQALQCDCFIVAGKEQAHDPEYDVTDDCDFLADYDVVITLHPFLKKKHRPEQIFCYIEPENPAYTKQYFNRTWSLLDQVPIPPYDYLLNNYTTFTNNNRNIPCPYYYNAATFESIPKKNLPYIAMISRRGVPLLSSAYAPDLGRLSCQHELWGKYSSYTEYLRVLATCGYCLNPDISQSPGQIIGESCFLDVITFAPQHKLLSKLLLPPFCHITVPGEASLSPVPDWVTRQVSIEVADKINKLDNDSKFKENILNEIRERRKQLHMENFASLIQRLVTQHENTLRK